MDQLWAPWRLSYVTQPQPPKAEDDCFLCRILSEDNDKENYIVERHANTCVVLNRFPYNNGHLLIAPNTHKGRLDELDADESAELQQSLTRMIGIIESTMKPDGFNVGLNLGKVAGAGLPGHLHWHLVPRWNGDTNFMSVFNDTRVIVQSLDALWELLNKESH